MLAKRERNFVIVTVAAVVLLALDHYALTPLLDSRDYLVVQRQTLQAQWSRAQNTMVSSRAADRRWKVMHAAGLSNDASSIESSLLNAMRSWSQDTGLRVVWIRPDRAAEKKGLGELTFQASGDGTMRSVAGFIYKLETAQLPVRIRELQIASRTDGTDDLTVQLRISTLWDAVPPVPPAPPVPPVSAESSKSSMAGSRLETASADRPQGKVQP